MPQYSNKKRKAQFYPYMTIELDYWMQKLVWHILDCYGDLVDFNSFRISGLITN